MKTREQLAREWAERFTRDVTSVTHEHVQAAIAFILEATKPQTMDDMSWAWNSEKHFLIGVTDGYENLVALDMQRLVEGDPVELLVCDTDGSDGVSRRDPVELTPNGKRYRLVEETGNPKVLKSESDYESAPVGTIVCKSGSRQAFVKSSDGRWEYGGLGYMNREVAESGVERTVLRWGYGESHAR